MSAIRPIGRAAPDADAAASVIERREPWGRAGVEPSLREMFADPLVHMVMARDGVTPEILAGAVAEGRARLRRSPCWGCAA